MYGLQSTLNTMNKLLLFTLILLTSTHTALAATVRTVVVKEDGTGDYISLAAAENGERANLVTLDRALHIRIEGTWLNPVGTVSFLPANWTTSEDCYIWVYVSMSTGARHSGKWSSSAFRIEANNATQALMVQIGNIYFDGLQVQNTGTGFTINFSPTNDLLPSWYINCITRGGSGARAGGGTSEWGNCIFYGSSGEGLRVTWGGSRVWATVYNSLILGAGTYGIVRTHTSGSCILNNVYIGGSGTASWNVGAAGFPVFTTCAISDDLTRTGVTPNVAYSTTTGARFVNIVDQDFHIQSDSALRGAGTAYAEDYLLYDIDGDTRTAPWDIGPDFYVAGGEPPPTPSIPRQSAGFFFP
jgi:hypothetical protein